MAKQFVITESEMQSLIDQLELKSLREKNHGPRDKLPDYATYTSVTDDIHRAFHYVVVRWAQEMGFKGYHG